MNNTPLKLQLMIKQTSTTPEQKVRNVLIRHVFYWREPGISLWNMQEKMSHYNYDHAKENINRK